MRVGTTWAASRPTPGGGDGLFIGHDGRAARYEGGEPRVTDAGGSGALLVVASGVGDEPDEAAAAAIRVVGRLFDGPVPAEPAPSMLRYIRHMHDRLRAEAGRRGPIVAGASLTAAWVLAGQLHWAQLGGTALLLVRDGRVSRLSPAHTRREFAVRDGRPAPADADALAQAFLYGSRGFGDDAALRLEEGLDCGVEYLAVGDAVVLCAPAVRRALGDAALCDALRRFDDPQRAADEIARRAGRSAPGPAAIIARIDRVPTPTVPLARPGTGATFL